LLALHTEYINAARGIALRDHQRLRIFFVIITRYIGAQLQ